jgi:hypothetical protein
MACCSGLRPGEESAQTYVSPTSTRFRLHLDPGLIDDDRMDPSEKTGTAGILIDMPERKQVGSLHGIFGIGFIP